MSGDMGHPICLCLCEAAILRRAPLVPDVDFASSEKGSQVHQPRPYLVVARKMIEANVLPVPDVRGSLRRIVAQCNEAEARLPGGTWPRSSCVAVGSRSWRRPLPWF